jgi:hypothetical protein
VRLSLVLFLIGQAKVFGKMTMRGKKSIIKALNKIGTKPCLELAAKLVQSTSKTISFHLREAMLDVESMKKLCIAFIDLNTDTDLTITSLSFSFNPQISDKGISLLLKNMPHGLVEVGLVGCGMTDVSGEELLSWLKKNEQLRLLCIENNNLSEELKLKFKKHVKLSEGLYLEV